MKWVLAVTKKVISMLNPVVDNNNTTVTPIKSEWNSIVLDDVSYFLKSRRFMLSNSY